MTNNSLSSDDVRRAFREDIGTGGIALAGSYFAALPVLRRLRRELRG